MSVTVVRIGPDAMAGSTLKRFMTSGTMLRKSTGFARNYAVASGSGFNTARLLEIQATDTLFGRLDVASLGPSRVASATGFDEVLAEAVEGASPTKDVADIDYILQTVGDWI